jgi:hypothetical protein
MLMASGRTISSHCPSANECGSLRRWSIANRHEAHADSVQDAPVAAGGRSARLSNDIDLQIVDCSRRPVTAGTMACNYRRACGYLTIDGQDVGDVLIAENLAHPRMCGKYSCPPPQSCCPLMPGIGGAER